MRSQVDAASLKSALLADEVGGVRSPAVRWYPSHLQWDQLVHHGTKQTPWWAKWWVLFWFSYLSALQSLLWMTFSSVPDVSREWLQTDNQTLDLWLDWGPVAFCVAVIPATWLLGSSPRGLRWSMIVGAFMCTIASVLRCLPAVLDHSAVSSSNTGILASIHIAQFINGAVAPFVVASPALLSLIWFDENSRNTATAIGNVANAVGRGVGFFLGPAIAKSAGDMPTLLYLEIGLAVLPLIALLLYLPSVPTTPPSSAALAQTHEWEAMQRARAQVPVGQDGYTIVGVGTSSAAYLTPTSSFFSCGSFKHLLSFSFLLVAASGGLQMALYGGWSGLLTTILAPPFTDTEAGIVGSANTFAGIVGGLLVGVISDLPKLRHHLKTVISVLALSAAAVFAVFAVAVYSRSEGGSNGRFTFNLPFGSLVAICSVGGLLRGGTDPLFFELTAEVGAAVGASAAVAGGFLTFFYHILLCIMLSIPASVLQAGTTIAMPTSLVVAVILLLPASVRYTRR